MKKYMADTSKKGIKKEEGTTPPLTKNTNLNQTCYKKTNHLMYDYETKVNHKSVK